MALFYEPDFIRYKVDSNFSRLLKDPSVDKSLLIKTYTEYTSRIGSFTSHLKLCNYARLLTDEMQQTLQSCLEVIKQPHDHLAKPLHYMRSLCESGGFTISEVAYLNKLTYNQIAFASSPDYLYLYISSPVGMMLKVGTGQNNT